MRIYFFGIDRVHPLSGSATRPIGTLATRLAALPLLAQDHLFSVARCVVAPRRLLRQAGHSHATSLACFQPSKPAQTSLVPRQLPYPVVLPVAHSGASN